VVFVATSFVQRELAKAVEKLGVEKVARRLGVRPATLRTYLEGERPLPDALLLRILDELPALRDS
jgi:hypothetical protein